MKTFTSPDGIFEIEIPLEWDYKNEIAGIENESPYSFESFKNSIGAFQISCYLKTDKNIKTIFNQSYMQRNLEFKKRIISDNECFKTFIWYTTVEDYFFMAKFICQPSKESDNKIKIELTKVENCLKTLICLKPDLRKIAVGIYRYEKFIAGLGATFDLMNNAIENKSFIELTILLSNQIDAYLRVCIVLKYQIIDKTDLFRIEFLHQKDSDKPKSEKTIYQEALNLNIIDKKLYDKLYIMYNERNKVVHRYIISDIKTFNLINIVSNYAEVCEEIRLILEQIEKEQFKLKVGYFQNKKTQSDRDEINIKKLHSMINEKHFIKDYYRPII